ncbi:MAG: hypothetical protein AAF433_11870 [Bacteroidota bacterium]
MTTYVLTYSMNERGEYVPNERLGSFLTTKYQDQNTKLELQLGDKINIDGGYQGMDDNYIYEILNREHWFSVDGTHYLRLWVKIIQDRNNGYYIGARP